MTLVWLAGRQAVTDRLSLLISRRDHATRSGRMVDVDVGVGQQASEGLEGGIGQLGAATTRRQRQGQVHLTVAQVQGADQARAQQSAASLDRHAGIQGGQQLLNLFGRA